ncbi:hypothetical protein D3C83_150120 [compost metagenome]
MRLAKRVKSLSLDTRQKPSKRLECSRSMASITSAMSDAFLPVVKLGCCTCWIECSRMRAFQAASRPVVKSP